MTATNLIMLPTEYDEGKALMDWARLDPLLSKFLIHIANERKTSWQLGKKFKHLGVKSGVSDYFLPVPISPYHGLWIELKRRKFYKISLSQKHWVTEMNNLGYRADFAFGAEHAIQIITDYLRK